MDTLFEWWTKIYQDRRIALILSISIISILLFILFYDVKLLKTHQKTIKPVVSQQIHNVSPPSLTDISTLHLFGQAPPQNTERFAQKTTLNIKLIGTLSMPSKSGSAIISANGEAHTYAVGDSIAGEASIKKIYPDRVILSRNGIDEILILETAYPSFEISNLQQTEDVFQVKKVPANAEDFCAEYLSLSPEQQKVWRATNINTSNPTEQTQQTLQLLNQCFQKP